jgi:hypothetical protein
MKTSLIAALLGLGAGLCSPAWADQTAAEHCATGLAPVGKTMFEIALPKVLTGSTPRDALTGTARDMVMSGKITRDTAKTSAEAAAECLKVLK